MKRILSLVLVLALVLGMVPAMSFAANETAGETLKEMGLLKGDAEGNLNEGNELTRAEMMVVLARMNKVEDEAKSYEIPSAFADAEGHWAANYIAYAAKEGWTAGTSATTFEPNGLVTVQQAATLLLRVLKYDDKAGDFTYAGAVAKAKEVGVLANVNAEGTSNILRGDLFIAMVDSLELVANGSTMKLGVELGVVEMPVADLDMKDAEAKSHVVVEVALNTAADSVSAADFSIVAKNGAALEVVSADLVDSKTIWVGTEAQSAGTVYTVTVGDEEVTFTGVTKDKSLPVVNGDSMVKDNQTVLVVFTKEMDRRNVLDASNYTITNGLEVIKVGFNTDDDGDAVFEEVLLTTSAQVTGRLYEVTAEKGITDMDGNVVDTEDDNNSFKFGGLKADVDAPEVDNVTAQNAEKITILFDEASDLTKATAEDIANYTIVNKTDANQVVVIESAELNKDADGMYTEVEIRTSVQTTGNTYEVTVMNVADKFGNVIGSSNDDTFIGQPADTTGPKVEIANGTAYDTVEVKFNEELDADTAEDASNYSINNDLTVIKAELVGDNGEEDMVVELTTSAHKEGQVYKVTVSNVEDEFGNEVGSSDYAYFAGVELEDDKPVVKSAYADVDGSKTYVYVTFNEEMENDTTEVGSNFYFGSEVGYGISVDQVDSGNQYKVRVNDLDDTTRYTVTVSNATDLSGNVVDADDNDATFVGVSVDEDDDTEILTAVTVDQMTVKVIYNRKMNGEEGVEVDVPADKTVANNPYNYVLVDRDDSVEGEIAVAAASLNEDLKTVVLTLEEALTPGHTYDLNVMADEADELFGANAAGVTNEDGTMPLLADNASFIVAGSSTEVDELTVDNVYTTSSTTVSMTFNKDIVLVGAIDKIEFDHSGAEDRTAEFAIVDPNNDDVLLVKVNEEFSTDGTYEVTILAGLVKEKYTNTSNAVIVAEDEFHASRQDVLEPSVASAVVVDDGKMEVVFTKDMDDATTTDVANYEIQDADGDALEVAISHVEFKEDTNNTVFVYFDNTELEVGKVYILFMDETDVNDILMIQADGDQEIEFSIGSEDAVDAPEVLELREMATVEGVTEYKILFSEAVEFDVIPAFAVGVEILEFTKAYETGDKVEVAANVFMDELSFTVAEGDTLNKSDLVQIATMSNKAGIEVAADAE